MSEPTLSLNCSLLGRDSSEVFEVEILKTESVSFLKDLIKERLSPRLNHVDAPQLTVWKVSLPVDSITPELTVDDVGGRQELHSVKRISLIFRDGEALEDEYVHILVQAPIATISPTSSNKSNRLRSVPFVSNTWSPRKATVCRLYEILIRERLVHVRGTPGCGKTTLMNLLHAYILKQVPSAFVHVQTMWPPGKSDLPLDKRLRLLDPEFPRCDGRGLAYLLFDRGHQSYEDRPLWNDFFKRVCDGGYPLYRVVLFCSYGSPSSRPVPHRAGTPPTPLVLSDAARISLWPRNETKESIGILLKRSEFDEVVLRFERQVNLHADLLNLIFEWTVGHVGAVIGMLNIISCQRVAATRHEELFTVENFLHENPIHKLARELSGGAFGRGLPISSDLSFHPDVAAFFRELLGKGTIKASNDEYENEAIRICHSSGWIHPDEEEEDTYYAFPSPLHAMCVSWRLSPTNKMPEFACLFDLALDVISKFKPSQLQLPIHRVGPRSMGKPLEAQYQDEFYRSLFSITFGNVCISPEFASARGALVAGRIDFFIPVKKWGVEITRDGRRLTEHSSRFAEPGAYAAWLKSGNMVDYVLLDCRTSIPTKAHPDIPNLLHVVFYDGYEKVVVYDNRLTQVKGPIALLENHY